MVGVHSASLVPQATLAWSNRAPIAAKLTGAIVATRKVLLDGYR
jgi:hypothetical protein